MAFIRNFFISSLTLMALSCSDASDEDSTLAMTAQDGRAQILFHNKCDRDVTFGLMGKHDLGTLKPGQKREIDLGPDNRGYPALAYYAYHPGQHPGFGHMTLAEFTLNTNFNKMDFYDVSAVDGYNIGMKIVNGANFCRPAICGGDVLQTCPQSQRIVRNGQVIACTKFGDRDNPNNPATRHFENKCENAYSWSKDDAATVGCTAQDYIVTLCPYR